MLHKTAFIQTHRLTFFVLKLNFPFPFTLPWLPSLSLVWSVVSCCLRGVFPSHHHNVLGHGGHLIYGAL